MAPSPEDLDGPSNVMPRPIDELERFASTTQTTTGGAVALRWQEPPITARMKGFIGNLWYGRATPA